MPWPVVTDDLGDKVSGTIFNRALTDAMKGYIDDLVVSAANPGVNANDIIDEVVTARGTKASLDARLDVALNEDGTPKAVAGQATEAQVAAQHGSGQLTRNGNMDAWSAGVAAAPDYYVLSGGTVSRDTPGATGIDTGYSARVTSTAAAQTLTQRVISATEMAQQIGNLAGRKVAVGIRVRCAGPAIVRLIVNDGFATTTSAYATGTGSTEQLTVTHTINNAATYLDVIAEVAAGTLVASVGAWDAVFSNIGITNWIPTPPGARIYEAPGYANVGPGSATLLTGRGGWTVAQEAGFTTPALVEVDVLAFTLPANTLTAAGQRIVIEHGYNMPNANAGKTIKVYFGADVQTVYTGGANLSGYFRAIYTRVTAAAGRWIIVSLQNGVAVVVASAVTAVAHNANQTVRVTYQTATAAGDIVSRGTDMKVEL